MPIGRLKKRAEFLAVNAANRKFVTHGVIVQIKPQAERTGLRVGYTVSRKVGNAVARNRARRRLRAAVAEILPAHSAHPCDLVLIGRTNTLTRTWDELRGDLTFAFTKLGIIPKTTGPR
jgi:ribonuclease P protein component